MKKHYLLVITLALVWMGCGNKTVKKHAPKEIKRDTTMIMVWNINTPQVIPSIRMLIDSSLTIIDSNTDKATYKDVNDTIYFVQIPGDTVRDANKKIVLDSLKKPKINAPQWLPLNKKILLQDYNKNVFSK